jgi:hypothetical protein
MARLSSRLVSPGGAAALYEIKRMLPSSMRNKLTLEYTCRYIIKHKNSFTFEEDRAYYRLVRLHVNDIHR